MTVIPNPISIHRYTGHSSDTKPTQADPLGFAPPTNASTFYEYDTRVLYITPDGTNWYPKEQLAGLGEQSTFGEPIITSGGNAKTTWDTASPSRAISGYAVKMSPGYQSSWDDYSLVKVSVQNMPLVDLTDSKWMYQMTATEQLGMSLVIHVHNPLNLDQEAEISIDGTHADIDKTVGYNSHELDTAAVYFNYYGYSTGSAIAKGVNASLEDFQADAQFSTWVIDSIGVAFGYHNSYFFQYALLYQFEVNGIPIILKPSVEEQLKLMRDSQANALATIPTWTYGQPTVFAHNNSRANWELGRWDVSTHQKGSTNYAANLVGGLQTGGASAAGVSIPVNETPVSEFNTAKWSYFLDAAHAHGVNIVFWCHDPAVHSRRVEITQSGSSAGVGKGSGQNSNTFPYANADMFYSGEIVGAGTPDTCPTAYVNYKWTDFQIDSVFSRYTIYKITFEFGMLNDAITFTSAYLEEVELNGTVIRLFPEGGKFQKTVTKTKTLVGGANSAFDVLSESAGAGTDWDFEFGGQGKIVDAVVTIATTALTAEMSLHCFDKAPTCNLHDNVANTSPVAADVPFFKGAIELPALRDYGTAGLSYTHASPSTPGGLPLRFNADIVKAVLISVDAMTPGAVLCTISLTAEMEYN